MHLSNNVILITGGTSGIGFELLQRFHRLGNRLIATSSNETNLAKLKDKFPDITTRVCDLADENSVQQLIARCAGEHSDINVVINSAGVHYNYAWTEEKDGVKKISAEVKINFVSPMQIIYGLLPSLIDKQSAAIINISSGLALAPTKSAPVYCATKAAVHSATKSLRYQLANTPVKVFEIIPPPVDTTMSKDIGKGKISARQLVDEFLRDFQHDKLESNIGKIKYFRFIQRIWPKFADNMKKDE